MQPDDVNISDACLLVLRRYYPDWIPPLVPRGAKARPTLARPRGRSAYIPKRPPDGLRVPRGLTWNPQYGCYVARFQANGKNVTVGRCKPEQAAIDALAHQLQEARDGHR